MNDRRVPGSTAIFVTPAEVKAAQMKVSRMRERGQEPSAAVLAIANARPDPATKRLRSQSA